MPRPDGSVTVAVCVLFFPAVPFIGLILQIGITFTFGGLATFASFIGAVAGLVANFRRPGAGAWALSVGINSLAAWYFYWLFFIHGLC